VSKPLQVSKKLLYAVGLVTPFAAAVGGGTVAQGLRFNSAGVLDLAAHGVLLSGPALQVRALDAATARAILAAPVLDQEHATLPFSDSVFGCPAESRTCIAQHERQQIATHSAAVERDGRRLIVKPDAAAPVTFVDWTQATTRNADGDSETHSYLGALPGNGLHRIEVQFGHDAPGSFLVDPKSGKTAFVHNGSDIVALSPDARHLITFNPDNPPARLRIAALGAAGPRLELECSASTETAAAQLKGWHDAQSVDLVIAGSPLRLTRVEQGWTVAAATHVVHCQAP